MWVAQLEVNFCWDLKSQIYIEMLRKCRNICYAKIRFQSHFLNVLFNTYSSFRK